MNQLPLGFIANGLAAYQSSDDPSTFYYLPAGPTPDLPAGRPTLRLITATSGLFTMGAVWMASPDAVQALQTEVLKRYPQLNPDLLEIDAAPPSQLSVAQMELALTDEAGERHVLATSKTSGMPPFNTVFSATLEEPLLGRARLALEKGQSGILSLTIRYALQIKVSAAAQLAGDVGPMLESQLDDLMDGDPSAEVTLLLVDEAIAIGALKTTVTVTPHGELGRDLGLRALKSAKLNAAKLVGGDLLQLIAQKKAEVAQRKIEAAQKKKKKRPDQPAPPRQPYQARVEANASLTESVRAPSEDAEDPWLSAATDLGSWVAADRGHEAKGG